MAMKKKTIKRSKMSDPLPRVIAAVVTGRVIKEKDLRLSSKSTKLSKQNNVAVAIVPQLAAVLPPWAAFIPKMTNERIHDRVQRRIAANRKRDD